MEQIHYGTGDNIAGNKIIYTHSRPARNLNSIAENIRLILSTFPPEDFRVYLTTGDSEIDALGKEFQTLLSRCGWRDKGYIYCLVGHFPNGVTITTPEFSETVQQLANELYKGGLEVKWEKNHEDGVNIHIGPRGQ